MARKTSNSAGKDDTLGDVIPIEELTPERFRLEIAGLLDAPECQDNDTCRSIAIKLAVLLAKHYDRKTLDPMRVWHRVETAMKTGIDKRTEDAGEMVSQMFEHVKADVGGLTGDNDFLDLLKSMEAMSRGQIEQLAAYINKALYVVIAHARSERKKGVAK